MMVCFHVFSSTAPSVQLGLSLVEPVSNAQLFASMESADEVLVLPLVQTLLQRLGAECDEFFIAYLAASLADDCQDPAELLAGGVDEQLAAICPGVAAEERQVLLLETIEQVQAVKAEAQQRRVSKRTQSLAPQLQQQQQQQPSACSSREGSDRGVGTSVEPCDLHVDQLLALCPADISRPFIAHLLLQGFKGDIQAVADFVLECDNLPAREKQFHRQMELQLLRDKEESAALERSRQQVVARFALQAVKDPTTSNRRAVVPMPLAHTNDKAEAPKVRYLNAVPVHVRKGEKYLVENLQEEWDGGSRGRVKTKGKRGKGFA